jgi:acyl carrier protein phosphodiesterase
MNFLAHLYLADGDDDLMLGGLLGDFVRGRRAMWSYPYATREGIRLHRRIDKITDSSSQVKALQKKYPKEFRRYSGIVIDLAFDHVLANNWSSYSSISLAQFDAQVREVLARHSELLPEKLKGFMEYADRRGLFENYLSEDEMLFSLAGIGTRLKRANPLHRVAEIWPDLKQDTFEAFDSVFPEIQSNVAQWRKRRSMTTGS